MDESNPNESPEADATIPDTGSPTNISVFGLLSRGSGKHDKGKNPMNVHWCAFLHPKGLSL